MEQHIRPNLQYAIFCSEFVESSGQVSILGVLDGVDVRGTIQRGQPVPLRSFPSNWSWASTRPKDHTAPSWR